MFTGMVPLADTRLESIRQSGALIVGELTNPLPNARTLHFPDDSHAITIFSGLINFYEYVCTTLIAATTMHDGDRTTDSALSMHDVIANLKQLFLAWTPQGLAPDLIPKVSLTTLPPEYAQRAADLMRMAMSFVLSHELGHVLYYPPPEDDSPPPALTLQQETESDKAGSTGLLSAARQQGRGPARMSVAGMFIALRVLAVLADLGHKFGDDHPPPLDRLNNVVRAIRGVCDGEREYWSLTTIAYAFDEQLESAGAQAVGKVPPRSLQHAISRLRAILEEVAVGRQPETMVQGVMRLDLDELSDEDLGALAGMAAILFPEVPPTTTDQRQDKMWAAMSANLRASIAEFPPRARTVFQYAITQKAHTNE
jgi:hypothetical protein